MKQAAIGVCIVLAVSVDHAAPTVDAWRTFEGSWSAVGQQNTLPTEGTRPSSIVRLSGAVVLKSGDLKRGFQGEAIGFDDGFTVRAGRAVWTDDRGDRIFSELKGEPLETGRKFFGRISGGSGRYQNASGEYELTWQYVVRAEDGVIQGRSADLKGRVRLAQGWP